MNVDCNGVFLPVALLTKNSTLHDLAWPAAPGVNRHNVSRWL